MRNSELIKVASQDTFNNPHEKTNLEGYAYNIGKNILTAHLPFLAKPAVAVIEKKYASEQASRTIKARVELIDKIADGEIDTDNTELFNNKTNADLQLFFGMVQKINNKGELDQNHGRNNQTIKDTLKESISKSKSKEGLNQAKLMALSLAVHTNAISNDEYTIFESKIQESQDAIFQPSSMITDEEAVPLNNKTRVQDFENSFSVSENTSSYASAISGGLSTDQSIKNSITENPFISGINLAFSGSLAYKVLDKVPKKASSILDDIDKYDVIKTIRSSKNIPDNYKAFFERSHGLSNDLEPEEWQSVKEKTQSILSNDDFEVADRIINKKYEELMEKKVMLDRDGKLASADQDISDSIFSQLPEIEDPFEQFVQERFTKKISKERSKQNDKYTIPSL